MSKRKKPYFPNNWQAYHNCPPSMFDELPFEEFYDWRVEGWEIPSSIDCIIREECIKTGKITEHVYQRKSAAKKRIGKIMDKGNVFTLCTHDSCHYMYPKELEPNDE